jgi:hypothetical protein
MPPASATPTGAAKLRTIAETSSCTATTDTPPTHASSRLMTQSPGGRPGRPTALPRATNRAPVAASATPSMPVPTTSFAATTRHGATGLASTWFQLVPACSRPMSQEHPAPTRAGRKK